MTVWRTIEVELSAEDEGMMLVTGFAFRDADNVLTISEKGSAFLREWCRKEFAKRASHGTDAA